MIKMMNVAVAVFCCFIASVLATTPGMKYKNFLLLNVVPNGSIPRSFAVQPTNYFDKIPESEKMHHYHTSHWVQPCGRNVSGGELNNYTFQSERWLTTLGLNIYDAAIRCIALSLLGEEEVCKDYNTKTLVGHKTVQFGDIRGDHACKGVMEYGQCSDPTQSGVCGFCYGDGPSQAEMSLGVSDAYFFRLISDFWAIEGTVDARCPEKKHLWTWNDYKPILGENAWANFLGPVHNALIRAKYDYDKVADDDAAFVLGIGLMKGLKAMMVGDTGGFYYTPRNTWFGFSKVAQNIGSTFSVENQASLLAGLNALYTLINGRSTSTHKEHLPVLAGYIKGLKKLLLSAYSKEYGFFRQGATYDPKTKTLNWSQNGEPGFAVDCQTWVSSVLGTPLIDSEFGNGTAFNIWQNTKEIANYTCPSGGLCGVGYTYRNISGQVLSGEWTYGAMNWLQVMIHDSGYSAKDIQSLKNDYLDMEFGTYSYLRRSTELNGSTEQYDSVMYAGSRYYIPFGWFANPIPATSSTAWAVFADQKFNPLNVNKGAFEGVALDL